MAIEVGSTVYEWQGSTAIPFKVTKVSKSSFTISDGTRWAITRYSNWNGRFPKYGQNDDWSGPVLHTVTDGRRIIRSFNCQCGNPEHMDWLDCR